MHTSSVSLQRLVVVLSLMPALASTGIAVEPPSAAKVRIVLVGDSTVTDGSGWGLGFRQFLTDQAECINTAAKGRSSKSFIDEGLWKKALDAKGNYYLIQFGHNDQPGKGPERQTDPNTTYTQHMARYVEEARAIGAQPILVTSLTRRNFSKAGSGKIESTLGPYVEAVKRLATEKHVPLIDLHARSIALCEQLGEEKARTFNPAKPDGSADTTHLNGQGSVVFARLVVEELRKSVPRLAPCLRDEPTKSLASRAFNVRDYGAKGDGKTVDTTAIQKAIDDCGKAGGGVVRLTTGTYLSQPIVLQSKTTLQLDEGATLQATTQHADFMKTPVFRAIVIKNLTATCPKKAGVIVGLPESLITNVTLENVRISAQTGLTIRNAKAVELKDVQVEIQKGPPFIVENAAIEGLDR